MALTMIIFALAASCSTRSRARALPGGGSPPLPSPFDCRVVLSSSPTCPARREYTPRFEREMAYQIRAGKASVLHLKMVSFDVKYIPHVALLEPGRPPREASREVFEALRRCVQ